MDKQDIMLQLIQEVREDQKEIKATALLHRAETFEWQSKTDGRMGRIEVDLKEHIRRTEILEDLHGDNKARIEELEKPYTFLSNTKKIVLTLGAISGAIYTIIKFIEYFK